MIFGSQLCLHVHVIYTLSVFLLIGIIPQEHVLQARVDLERCLVIISVQDRLASRVDELTVIWSFTVCVHVHVRTDSPAFFPAGFNAEGAKAGKSKGKAAVYLL